MDSPSPVSGSGLAAPAKPDGTLTDALPTLSSSAGRTGLVAMLIASALGACLGLPGVAYFDGRFPVENLSVEMTNRIRNNREDPIAWAKERSNRWTSLYLTTASCLAVFGGCLGATLGLTHGLSRKSAAKTVQGFVIGAVVGAFAAALGGFLEACLLMKLESSGLDLTLRTMIGHAVAWSVLAAGLGYVCTLFARDRTLTKAAMCRGMIGGLIAAIIYSPAAAIFFQLQRSDLSVPEGVLNKFLFLISAALCIGYGLRTVSPGIESAQQGELTTGHGTAAVIPNPV